MGTCYSKSGHELDSSNPDKRPKERKKGSQKNGHLGSNHKLKLIVEDFDGVQKDVSDTVYTEDSHTFNGLEVDNLLHKSQQTSLDMLAKDTNRNSETFTVSQSSEQGDVNCSKDIDRTGDDNSPEWTVTDQKDHTADEIVDDMVVASDSGVVLENSVELEQGITLKCDHFGKTETHESTFKTFSEGSDKIQCDTAETKQQRDTVQSNCSNSNVNDSKPKVKSQSEHSSCNCYHDLDKLRLAVRHSSTSIQADQWSLSDSLDGNYDLPAVSSQPIRTMTMNGRDVVVIDQELFSQIIDEIQFLKMKLSQLTEVIGLQEMDGTDNSGNEGTSILSSSA